MRSRVAAAFLLLAAWTGIVGVAEALEAGLIAGAGLDVFEHEPAVDPRLLASRNVVLLPHMGSATFEARTDMGEKVIANILAFLEGGELPDRVA